MRKVAVVIALFVMQSTAHAAGELTCTISEKVRCSQGQGCHPVEATIIVRLNPEQQTYSRCDAKGCDDFQAQFGVSGNFLNIALPQNGMLAKVSGDLLSVMEVVTLGADVLVSYGSCK